MQKLHNKTSVANYRQPTSVLYISYDGLTDPLGRSQILPVVAGLSGRCHQITVLSCEKSWRLETGKTQVQQLCRSAGVSWRPLRYTKSPPILATLYDLARLWRCAIKLQRKGRHDLIHCRGYIPALVANALKRKHGPAVIFDMRGFWPDERVEAGSWPQNNPLYAAVYRYFKARESDMVGCADHLVSLTWNARHELKTWPALRTAQIPISVIPSCVDFEHFPLVDEKAKEHARHRMGLETASLVCTYLGSLGSWYMLEEMLDFFSVLRTRCSNAYFVFITPDAPLQVLRAASERSLPASALRIVSATYEQVPQYLAASDFGLFFIRPGYAKRSSCPTKLAEFTASGIPVITNDGVGDVRRIVTEIRCGVVISRFDRPSYRAALELLGKTTDEPAKIRASARGWFDLDNAIARYDAIYRSLAPATPI